MSEDTEKTNPAVAPAAPAAPAAQAPKAADSAADPRDNHRKVRIGTVVSDKQQKTIVVAVSRSAADPLYKKVTKITTKYYAHDEKSEAKVGDTVEIMETRPLSKLKRWRLVSIQKHAATD